MHGVVSYVKRCCILWAVFHAVHVGMILNGLNSAKKNTDFAIFKHFFHSNFLVYPRTKDQGLPEEVSNGNRSGGESLEAARLQNCGEKYRCQGQWRSWERFGGLPSGETMGFSLATSIRFFSSGMTVSFATFDFWVKNAGSFLARHKKLDLAGMGWQTLAMKETGIGWWSNVGLGPDHAYR